MQIHSTANIVQDASFGAQQTRADVRTSSDGLARNNDGSLIRDLVNQSNNSDFVRRQKSEPAAQSSQSENPQDTLNDMAEKINDALKLNNKNLEFNVDEETDITVIKVVDTETGEVIRQIPSEEMMKIASALQEGNEVTQGQLLSQLA